MGFGELEKKPKLQAFFLKVQHQELTIGIMLLDLQQIMIGMDGNFQLSIQRWEKVLIQK